MFYQSPARIEETLGYKFSWLFECVRIEEKFFEVAYHIGTPWDDVSLASFFDLNVFLSIMHNAHWCRVGQPLDLENCCMCVNQPKI